MATVKKTKREPKKEPTVELTKEQAARLALETKVKDAESRKRSKASKALNAAYDRCLNGKDACKRASEPWTPEELNELKKRYPFDGPAPLMLDVDLLNWAYGMKRSPSWVYKKWFEVSGVTGNTHGK
jgi:hypothetical protein